MLSKSDDYPIHQTPDPIAHPQTSDHNFYDRYWFNGYDRDAEFFFAVALGLYPNRRIMDAAFSFVRDGVQHSLHASRLAPNERTETTVGPLSIEVATPMRELRVRVAPNETGLECDLVFRARTAAIEEARTTQRRDTRVVMDMTRFTQLGRWEGRLGVNGIASDVRSDRSYGTRDRSWGVRPVGEPEAGPPASAPPGICWLWAPTHFDDLCTHAGQFQHPDGTPWFSDAMIVPAYDSLEDLPGVQDPALRHLDHFRPSLRFEPGTRFVSHADLDLRSEDGEHLEISLDPILRFQMLGIGYLHPEWGHGYWKGETALGGESWKLSDVDPSLLQHQHVQQLCRARMGEREGIGVLEQLILGPHAVYGFEEFLDPAR
ncbi:MAG: hypothetical protein ACE5IL_10735 [Myxococcota bacterium]